MEMILLKIGSPEWEYLWNWVSIHPISEGIDEPSVAFNDGEVWEYMGSYRHNGKILHQVRHRNHPSTNERKNLTVEASKDMNEDDIETKFGSVLK